MAWSTPKTNWTANDYINYQDYNRWKNNIQYLYEFSKQLYVDYLIDDMGADKNSYEQYPYADEINTLENNLQAICNNTFPFQIGETKTFYENQPFIDYEEINRLESGMLLIYESLNNQYTGRYRSAFKLSSTDRVLGGVYNGIK